MKVYVVVYLEILAYRNVPYILGVFSDKERAETFAKHHRFSQVIESVMDESEMLKDYDEILRLREENERLRSLLNDRDV